MTIFAICLHNDCKREENGDACIACPAEKIITIAGRLHRQDDPVCLGAAHSARTERLALRQRLFFFLQFAQRLDDRLQTGEFAP
jgi:hypothetical protein